MTLIDKYLEVSGANPEWREEFNRLALDLSKLPKDEKEVAIAIKDSLISRGFSYNQGNFTAQDVLKSRSGNCLGLPLLIGSLMDENGFSPNYQLTTRPFDVTSSLEEKFYDCLVDEMDYDNPQLAMENEEFASYMFAPLEHLVIEVNGGELVETTSEEHFFSGCESKTPLNQDEALSFVYKDRAVTAFFEYEDVEEAKSLANQGLALNPDNRQIYGLLATIAMEEFDDEAYENARENFQRIGGDDSLFHINQYFFTSNKEDLETSLKKYPFNADALVVRASQLVDSDFMEAKFLYAIASQCYANSMVLDIADFYSVNYDSLSKLFGQDKVKTILDNFEDDKFGDFNYHLARFSVMENRKDLAEAEEAVHTPLQSLRLYSIIKKTKHFNTPELKEFDGKYGDSKLYQEFKQSLNI